MIVQSSSIGMNSARRYNSKSLSYSGMKVWDNKTRTTAGVGQAALANQAENRTESGLLDTAKKALEDQEDNNSGNNSSFDNLMDKFRSTQSIKPLQIQERVDTINEIRRHTLDYLLYLLFGKEIDTDSCPSYVDNSLSEGNTTEFVSQNNVSQNNMSDEERYGGTMSTWSYYSEQETTEFSTTGKVVTADGKSIDFNINLRMSRSFVESTSSVINFGAAQYKDPLVINLNCGAVEVTDQKFYFDIDADGNEEYISQLGAGSGYLALDKNGDGIINDGSELFGTSSGNGFADLAQYDQDGNGWIDEADVIFDKLKIWSVDENGNSTLIGIGQAGVGAIYLGSSDTEFSLNDSQNNTNAVVRKTGIFLYENGISGTIQQLDMAT